ncbi:hypothetical protein BG011_009046 [Mortierella polycephala]|uniref:Glycoside hydrolase n=1 Tax=Mortierella polycephala TaxID=41804 RepID=A0A9P6TWH2_9FUNG|nr:hypothetical protein BG011_009046 [Mortierella polycephala]
MDSASEPFPDPKPNPRLRVVPRDTFLRDVNNRACLLRGVNLSGSCKFPKYPVAVPSHVRGDAFLRSRVEPGTRMHSNVNSNVDVHANGNGSANNSHEHAIESSDFLPPNATVDSDERISFVGRPFELDEADEHLARLRHWGFRIVRWVVTWEAIEHQGPGIYDQEFLEYTVKALLKAKEYEFKVMIDFHQDVWSRFSGGSGAPLWTFYAAGLDPRHFAATGAAVVHNTLQPNELMPRMVWLTNYYKLACATMFTLFYAGGILASQCTFNNGVNIQEYLQSHFLNTIKTLVEKIHECKDSDGNNVLEDTVVLGYDSWNEPSCGWIGLERLDVLPEQHDMRQGDMPTPMQSLMLGEGQVVKDIATYRLELVGPVKSGSRNVDPSAHVSVSSSSTGTPVKAWLSPNDRQLADRKYGFQRDPGFPKAGECLWAQHGVWSVHDRKVLQQDYFARGPWKTGSQSKPPLIQWVPDQWLPFAKRVTQIVRKIHPTAILFLEPPVYVPPPTLVQDSAEKTGDGSDGTLLDNMVYAPHHYDDLVLLTKRYLGWVNIDLLGLSRGRHKTLAGSVILGKKATKNLFGNQIQEIQKECYERLGTRPVLIGETGLHFDVGLGASQQAGNRSIPSDKGDDEKQPKSWFKFPWAGKRSEEGKGARDTDQIPRADLYISNEFQHAFDNILDGLDRTLAHYTLWNYTIENDVQYGDGWNGENLSLYSADTKKYHRDQTSDPTVRALHPLDHGGRAIEQFCRPYPIATVGQPIDISFDRHSKVFKMRTRTNSSDTAWTKRTIKTEIYVPRVHFSGPEHCCVKVSDGTWEWDVEQQLVVWEYNQDLDGAVSESKSGHDHWIEILKGR